MSESEIVAVLARTGLFADLDPSDQATLSQQCRLRRYTKAQRVFARGEIGEGLFIVAAGSVALTVSTADGGELVLAVLHPPQWFGELAVIDRGPRVATATAREPTILVSVPRTAVEQLIATRPAVALALLSSLTGMIRRADDQAVDLALVSLTGRLTKLLVAAADKNLDGAVANSGDSVLVDLRFTQTELAQLVGGSRQQVNRIIVELERQGAITRIGSRIVAVRPDRLAVTGLA